MKQDENLHHDAKQSDSDDQTKGTKAPPKKANRKAGGRGERRRAGASRKMGFASENFSTMASPPFDWTCPKCSLVGKWKKPWSPEGKQPLCWTCGWCKVPSDGWIWVLKAGWHRLVTDEDRKLSRLPILDHDLRWMFECECTAVHRPNDARFVKGDDGEPQFQRMEPTQFKVSCNCGRSREFRLKNGHWHEESFEYHPKEPAPHSEPAKPPEDMEPLTQNEFLCGYCGDSFTIEARSLFRHVCDRCGHVTKLAKNHTYRCGKCDDEFTWEVGREPWCMRCQDTENLIDTGRIVWERPPSTAGSLRIGGDFADKLWGRDGKEGLLHVYEKAAKEGRASLGYEVRQMANHMLAFLVQLAEKFEDYDAVRWLAKYADLGKRRVPDDDSKSIEDKLNNTDKSRAAREWRDVRAWMDKARHHVSKSQFTTHMRRITERAGLWRWGYQIVREARANPRLQCNDDEFESLEKRKQSWIEFLDGWGIKSDAKTLPLPYPANFDEKGEDEFLLSEVLIPMVRWWQRNDPADYAKAKYPKDTSQSALERDIRKALRIQKEQPPTKKEPEDSERLEDG